MVGGAAFPPARIIIVFGHFIEAKLLVIIGSYPFSGVDGALLQRRINIATSDLLRDNTKLAERFAGPAPDTHLEPFEVCGLLDLLVEPAAHLAARIAGKQALGVELGAELVDQFLAITVIEPCILLAGIKAEWNGAE